MLALGPGLQTTRMALWNSASLKTVYTGLIASGAEFVVIGGQAINLWSEHYRLKGEIPDQTWAAHVFVAERPR